MEAHDFRMLGKALEASKENKIHRLAEVEAETQAEIDKYNKQLMESSLEMVKRYHAFKLGLWNDGDRIVSDPLWNITRVNPDALEFSEVYDPDYKIVFKDTSHDSDFYFAVPLTYFDNPEKWEKDLLVWLENVNAMVQNAPQALGEDFSYKASTIGLKYPGDYFRLHQKSLGEKPVTYLVSYHTGEIYTGGVSDVEATLCEPIGSLG